MKDIDAHVQFELREGMSDKKAVDEVVARRCYARHGFTPRPGDRWLDLGANVGAFSVWAAAHGSTVTAWEPEPGCYEAAERNLALNSLEPLVDLRNAAVWSHEKPEGMELSVNSARGNVWRSSLLKMWQGSTLELVPIESIVPFWTPDACVKMDIEGSELPILMSLGERPVQKLVFEYSFDILPNMETYKQLMELLRDTYRNVHGGPGDKRLSEPKWITRGPANGIMTFCW